MPLDPQTVKKSKTCGSTTQGITLTVITSQILQDLVQRVPAKCNKNKVLAASHRLIAETLQSKEKPRWWNKLIKNTSSGKSKHPETPRTREGYLLSEEKDLNGTQINTLIGQAIPPKGKKQPGLACMMRCLLELSLEYPEIAQSILKKAEGDPAARTGRVKPKSPETELTYRQSVWIIRGTQQPEPGKPAPPGCRRKVKGTYLGFQPKIPKNPKIPRAACWIQLDEDDPLAMRHPFKKNETGPWPPYRVKPRT
jgi:hypothetical protein